MYGHTDLEFRDSTWFDGENGNKCTLVSTPAGVGSVSTEAPPKNAIEKTMEAQTESTSEIQPSGTSYTGLIAIVAALAVVFAELGIVLAKKKK